MKALAELFLLASLFAADSSAPDCTVFFAFDGKSALAGSNEDWADPNCQVWFVPATKDSYGVVYFGFGRGEYPPGGVSRHKLKIPEGGLTEINPEDLYGLPQGGMNDQGLFFDGASTEIVKGPSAPGKTTYDGRLEDLLLRKCATVQQALKLLESHAFNSAQGQWLFADKSGDSIIVEAGDVILRKQGHYQVITNFLQSKVKPDDVTCPRYQLVTRRLNAEQVMSLDLVRSLLKATVQKGAAYSTIFDLTRGEIYVYHQADFDRPVKIVLEDELRRGQRAVKIRELIPK